MATDETRLLREELERYRAEKERIRRIVGQIGGQPSRRMRVLEHRAEPHGAAPARRTAKGRTRPS